ncbi:DUF1523 family protein [Salipiger mucosus]|uniref:DUF1523 domain-containing protein n=1 Tax=Salipiger mucosus DSM 16094 TaxID=1123237 RepID=S9QTK6_9RHOB|nr:DUF1523 family protein [Salipiger mucosus]EPX82972.1 hypothetical protein Salmuc_04123 [Salipiger mucosus DSM 16094]
MRYFKWAVIALFWLLVAGFLHYTLPQHDVARITDTYEKRIDPGENSWFWSQAASGDSTLATNRDVFFIQTRLASDGVMVYRNEDTGWGWPPYFKFDTANLQAEAADMRSTAADPQWVVIRHYGWRNEFLSIYPNAVSIRPVAGPDVTIVPWLNIVILVALAAVVWAIWVRWRRFRQRRIDPVMEDMNDGLADAGDRVRGLFGRKKV